MKFDMFQVNEQIEELLDQYMDIETGEISPEAEEALGKLSQERLEIVRNISMAIKNHNAMVNALKSEIDKLQTRVKEHVSRADWLTRFLGRTINDGEKFETPEFQIKWTTSTKLAFDEFSDKANPDTMLKDKYFKKFVNTKITHALDKKALMDAVKAGNKKVCEVYSISKTKNLKVN